MVDSEIEIFTTSDLAQIVLFIVLDGICSNYVYKKIEIPVAPKRKEIYPNVQNYHRDVYGDEEKS